jgi:hypothetical protein
VSLSLERVTEVENVIYNVMIRFYTDNPKRARIVAEEVTDEIWEYLKEDM